MKLFAHLQSGAGASCSAGRLTTVVCQARGFGNRKRSSSSRKPKISVNTEVQQLLGEYSAVKQSPLPVGGTSRATPTSRTKQPTTKASAATHTASSDSSLKHPVATPSAGSSSSTPQAVKPTGWGNSPVDAVSSVPVPKPPTDSKPEAGVTVAATGSKPAVEASTTSSDRNSSSSGPATPAAAAPSSTDVPLPLPVPNIVQAAGKRHAAFESKLTSKAPPAAPEAAPQLPTVEEMAADAAANKQLSSTISRLSAAHDDLAQAEAHVDGLAQLLQEAQATLASLQIEEGSSVGADQAAVGVAAGQLVGLMSDVLSDITAEMGLVSGQLLAARGDIDASLLALEEAAQTAPAAAALPPVAALVQEPPAVPELGSTSSSAHAADSAVKTATAEAEASREAAEREAATLRAQLELRDAELAVVQQRNTQLQAQLALLSSGEPGGVEGNGEKSVAEVDPRIRALLASQVASNMALLDWLAALAKTVVGLEGVAAADRVRLATAISKCVLAVGGGGPDNTTSTASPQQ